MVESLSGMHEAWVLSLTESKGEQEKRDKKEKGRKKEEKKGREGGC